MKYREIPLNKVLKFWDYSEILNVYIHTPFCEDKCKYCIYQGVKCSKEKIRYYAYQHLPEQINRYEKIFTEKKIKSFFFGGGTPSLLDADMLDNIFSEIPKFKSNKIKIFEIHPAYWEIEQLDILKKYNFNAVIICVQSFNKTILKTQNRTWVPFDKIKELVELCKKKEFYIFSDLILFFEKDIENNKKIFYNDLMLLDTLDVDEISAQSDFKKMNAPNAEFYKLNFFDAIIKFWNKNNQKYWVEDLRNQDMNNKEIMLQLKKTRKCFRFIRSDIDRFFFYSSIFPQVYSLDTIDEKHRKIDTLGIGSYLNPLKQTFSVIDKKYQYHEQTDKNWNTRYILDYDYSIKSYNNLLIELIRKINNAGPIPKEIKIDFSHFIYNKDADNPKNEYIDKVSVKLNTDIETSATTDYITKLKKIIPDVDFVFMKKGLKINELIEH